MTPPPKPSSDLTRDLFSGGNFALSPTGPLKPAFWYNLLRYRPLWLLAGLWFCCLLISMAAVGGLLDPGIETEKTPPTAQEPSTIEPTDSDLTDPDLEGFTTRSDSPDGSDITDESQFGTELEPVLEAELSLEVLLIFVGLCSSGCWLLSRYLQAPRRLPKARMRQRKSRPVPPAAQSAVPATAVAQPLIKRLKPFSADQVPFLYPDGKPTGRSAQAPNIGASPFPHPVSVAPTPTGQATPATGHPQGSPLTPPAPSLNPNSGTQAEANLVAEDETHALDWPEGSVAHQMDLRQRRSLSSLL